MSMMAHLSKTLSFNMNVMTEGKVMKGVIQITDIYISKHIKTILSKLQKHNLYYNKL